MEGDYESERKRFEDWKREVEEIFGDEIQVSKEAEAHYFASLDRAYEAFFEAPCPVCSKTFREHSRPEIPEALVAIYEYEDYIRRLRRENVDPDDEVARRELADRERKIDRAVDDYQRKKTKRVDL